MSDNQERIQKVINTLETMIIPASFDNVNRMLGIYQTLVAVREDLRKEEQPNEEHHAE